MLLRYLIGRRTANGSRIGDGRFAAERSVIDGVRSDLVSTALERAIAFAKGNQQPVVWDRTARPWAIALYDEQTKRLNPLSDEEVAFVLNRDALIAREWKRWNAMMHNEGSLVVLDAERVRRVLKPDEGSDTEIEGLA